ncbi:hypothetical protein COL5a_011808 [Colletotrichum fioriniae]|nr:hypothetical protein COL5a_011808 [Colletotrichum fioriniae]
MSYESSATEVAEDYRQALEDLTTNVRFEISNLTMIAREQTEHAQVISEVLQDHILKAPAHKKLPALYVLDSIVKNVGTPYTLFFGAKLYQTFMEAYAAVDGQVRRKMDEMLRTWKEPVPGSLDKRPVFASEVTAPIESALIKARTSALQAQQGRPAGRGRPAAAPYRETPTPPGMRPGSNQPMPYGQPPPMPQANGNRPPSAPLPPHPQMAPYAPPPPSYSAQPSAAPGPYQPPPQMPYGAGLSGPPQAAGINKDSLGQDIQKLIDASKLEFAQNPHDHSIQQRLKALLDVQSLLQHQNLPQDQLVLIKNQVADLAVKLAGFRPTATDSSTWGFQPHLIPSLFEQLGPQCTQCGRRFKTDDEGRKKKMAHMDWHFKAHQRLAEAEKRGQHRSWYVDNNDWLKSREAIDVDHVATADKSSSSPGRGKKEAKPRYIPVPDASSGINSKCPICQEKFENKWLETAQEWVWLDTTLVGNRAYHFSCHSEATQARESTPVYTKRAPEPSHGKKRKAEGDQKPFRGKMKKDKDKDTVKWPKAELDY